MGVWACEVTGRDLGVPDHGAMVWDEIVAFLPLAAISSASIWLQAGVFVLFRLFDIWKPYPIRELERHVKGGFGVMVDDMVAAFYAYVVFALFIILVVQGARDRMMERWPYPRLFAHRGGGTLAPENTLAAFRLGQSLGYARATSST